MPVKENNFTVKVHKQAQKNLLKIPKAWQIRIITALELLETDPYIGEKLWGRLEGSFKLRIWPYRIVYKLYIKDKVVYVTQIDHRQGVYK